MRYPYLVALMLAGTPLLNGCNQSEAADAPPVVQKPDADSTDPVSLGWMQGSPPPPEKLIMQPDSNYFSFPKLRWSVCHLRELLPTKPISRGLGAPSTLEFALDAKIDNLSFTPMFSDQPMTWAAALKANYTDGVVILHKGKVVYEKFTGCLNANGQHAAMSMTKSLTGLLAQTLIDEGKLDETAQVSTVVPELANSGFADATVRQVMDMTTGVRFSENYADPNADIWIYSQAASPLPKAEGYEGPDGYFDYLTTTVKASEHGVAFGYKTINADTLGWIISRVTGKPVEQLIAERIWTPLGSEQDAYITVDAKGTAFAGGGISAGLRDIARFGQLMLNRGQWQGQQLFPASVVERIEQGGDPALLTAAGYKTLPGASYSTMWWVLHNADGAYTARGVYGQALYIDPKAQMVIARFGSHPTAGNAANDPTSLPAYQAVADYLMSVNP
jgi:CubicO group peptidase (beta-lactamase class C family)